MSYTAADVNVSMYNQYVTFSVIPTGIIGTQFQSVKVLAVLDAKTALEQGTDIYGLHRSVYPSLVAAGVTVPNDATQYNWVKLSLGGTSVQIIGIPWIDFATFEVVVFTSLDIHITGLSNGDVEVIKRQLAVLGYNNASYQTS